MLAKRRNLGALHLVRDAGFDMMTEDRLVIEGRGELVTRLRLHIGKVDVENAGRRTVLRRIAIVRLRCRFLAPCLDRPDLDRRLGQMREQLALTRAISPNSASAWRDISGPPGVGVGMIEARIAAHEGEKGLQHHPRSRPAS